MQTSTVIPLRYIGKKPQKRLSTIIPGSPIVWIGHGDVQPVPTELARSLLRAHPDVFELDPNYVPDAQEQTISRLQSSQLRDAASAATPPAAPAELVTQPSVDQLLSMASDRLAGSQEALEAVEQRVREVMGAIATCKKAGDFDQGGRPKVSVLSQRLKRTVTAAERDAAWNAIQKALEARVAADRPKADDDAEQAPEDGAGEASEGEGSGEDSIE